MTYEGAMRFVLRLAAADDPRFRKAAARWHALYVLATGAELGESEMLLNMLRGLRGANGVMLQRRLLGRGPPLV